MDKYKKLVGNSFIFAIGNFGSKIITFLMVPLYTHYLSTSEYGMIDIVTTTISMLLPVISLSMNEAALRFVMDKEESKESVLINGLIICSLSSIIFILIYPILNSLNILGGFLDYMYIILVLQVFETFFAEFTRGIGKVKIYTINGVLSTIVMCVSNLILLVYLKRGIDGYFMSIILSTFASIIFLLLSAKIYKYIKFCNVDAKLSRDLLGYAVPLIPNTFLWWVINASSRYFLLYFEGANVNGLFAVANKIPTLLVLFSSIFNQAWKLSSIEEYESGNDNNFFSRIFNYYQSVLMLGTSAIMIILKILIKVAFAPEYYESWRFVPFLLLGVVFSSLSGFIGMNYIVSKKTRGIFATTLIGCFLCIVMNIILIPFIGGVGASISTMISFFIICLIRVKDTQKYVKMAIDYKRLGCNLFAILLQTALLFLNLGLYAEFCLMLTTFVILIIYNKKVLLHLFIFTKTLLRQGKAFILTKN